MKSVTFTAAKRCNITTIKIINNLRICWANGNTGRKENAMNEELINELSNILLTAKALKKTLNSDLAKEQQYINNSVDVLIEDIENLIFNK